MKLLINFLLLIMSVPVFAQSEWDISAPINHDLPEIAVYRSTDCHCCHRWIEHLQQHHFTVIDHPTENMADVKEKLGLPSALGSCHTAVIDGYIVEGHVPADDILRLVTEKPELRGLSVPQMPVGTPGMEMGERKDNFSVIGFDKNGKYMLFNHYSVGNDHRYHSQSVTE